MSYFLDLCESYLAKKGITKAPAQALHGHVFWWNKSEQCLIALSPGAMQNWFIYRKTPKKAIEMVTAGLALGFSWKEFKACWSEYYPLIDVLDLHAALLVGYMKGYRAFSKEDYEAQHKEWREKADNATQASSLTVKETQLAAARMLEGNEVDYAIAMESCLASYHSKSDRKYAHFKQAFERRRKEEETRDSRRNIFAVSHLRHAEVQIRGFLKGDNKQVRDVLSWCAHLRFTPMECRDVLTRLHRALDGNLLDSMDYEALKELLLERYTNPALSEPMFWQLMEEVYLAAGPEDRAAAGGLLFGLPEAYSEQHRDFLYGQRCDRPGKDNRYEEPVLRSAQIDRMADIKVLTGLFLQQLNEAPQGLCPAIDVESVYYRSSDDTFAWLYPENLQGQLCEFYIPQGINSHSQLLHLFCGLVYTIATNHFYTPSVYRQPKYRFLSNASAELMHDVLSNPQKEYSPEQVEEGLKGFQSD